MRTAARSGPVSLRLLALSPWRLASVATTLAMSLCWLRVSCTVGAAAMVS